VKAQCDRCKEIVALQFKTEAGGIRVTCPSCEAEYSVAATVTATATVTVTATATPTATVTPTACPKCGEPQTPGPACRRCGLAVAKWPDWNDLADAGDSSIVLGDVRAAAALFENCVAAWDDVAKHDAFLAHCERAGAWAYAAACYRRQTANPERRTLALTRLSDIRTRAEKALTIAPREAEAKPAKNPTRTLIILVVVVVLLVAGIFVITGRMAPHGR
jgi:DNA-directed RNA polymerase subunit M/transcription elongation factor TFIIS